MNPLKSDYEIVDIANEYLGLTLADWSELFGKADLTTVYRDQKKECLEYYAKETAVLRQVQPLLEQALKENGMDKLFRELEMPLSYVLYSDGKGRDSGKAGRMAAYGEALRQDFRTGKVHS